MEPLTRAALESAGKAVDLSLGLVGTLALFLGLMRVASDGGLLRIVARAASPVLRRLFPGVPADHPAMSAMILNIASNLLGLGNAATPFGLKAMMELDKLNGEKGTASNAMVVFLAINASGLSLLPTTVVAMRASAGSADPAGILASTWFASGCATLVAVSAAYLLARLPRYRAAAAPVPAASARAGDGAAADADGDAAPVERMASPRWGATAAAAYGLALAVALGIHLARGGRPAGEALRAVASFWILPAVIAGIVLFGWARGVKVYASLAEGAKEGFQVALRILPYLVAILVAVGMLRASGALDLFVRALEPLTGRAGVPAEVVPLAILRPLSGSGSFALMGEILAKHGPDSYIGYLASTLQGSTETTFYVLAVYFGAVGVRRTRHALPACLLGDLAGMAAAVFIVRVLFG